MANLIDDLRKLGNTLAPSEVPHPFEIGAVLSSLVKSLEHEGLKVAEELYPAPQVDEAAAAAERTATDATTALEALIARAEQVMANLDAQGSPKTSQPTSPSPTSPSSATPPPEGFRSEAAPSDRPPGASAPADAPPVVPAPPSWPPSDTPLIADTTLPVTDPRPAGTPHEGQP